MTDLGKMRCIPCKKGMPTLTLSEIVELRPQVPGWLLTENDGIRRLEKTFRFRDFAEALAFTNKVGRIAEQEDHHPAILTEWGRVTVTWWTHVIKGLHRNDFIMAAKTESLYRDSELKLG